jgi:hypothetical protein
VRVTGSPVVATVTWRALRLDAGGVVYEIESTARDAGGRVLSTAREEQRAAAAGPPPGGATVVSATPERVEAAGRALTTSKEVLRLPGGEETTVWRSGEVPFGVVRARGPGGVEQSLVAWGRGS